MPASAWTGRQGWFLLAGVGAACVAALIILAVLPGPSTSACNGCGGVQLGSVMKFGTPTRVGTATNEAYCFPVASVTSTIYLYLVDAGFQTPTGAWIAPDLNWTVTYAGSTGPPLAVYSFGNPATGDTDNTGWVSGGNTVIAAGGQFCVNSGLTSLSGETFVLAANAFSPTGNVTATFP